MYHSFVLLLRCHVDDKNLDPPCRNRTTALRLNKQVLTPISTPGLVGPESAFNMNSGSDSRKEPACVSGGHRGIIILTQLLLRKKKKRGSRTSRAVASGILLWCEWQCAAFARGPKITDTMTAAVTIRACNRSLNFLLPQQGWHSVASISQQEFKPFVGRGEKNKTRRTFGTICMVWDGRGCSAWVVIFQPDCYTRRPSLDLHRSSEVFINLKVFSGTNM